MHAGLPQCFRLYWGICLWEGNYIVGYIVLMYQCLLSCLGCLSQEFQKVFGLILAKTLKG